MYKLVMICLVTMQLLVSGILFAQNTIPKGIIVSKNSVKQTVTIRNQGTGNRHTYFLNGKTRIMSNEETVDFSEIKSGQAVSLDFARTPLGRELNLLRIPELDELTDIDYLDSGDILYISGVVTGVRPVKRTVTIRGPKLTQRLTLHVPDSVVVLHKDVPLKLRKVKEGDEVEFEYQDTSEGYIIIKGEITKRASQTKSKQ